MCYVSLNTLGCAVTSGCVEYHIAYQNLSIISYIYISYRIVSYHIIYIIYVITYYHISYHIIFNKAVSKAFPSTVLVNLSTLLHAYRQVAEGQLLQ